MNQLVFKKQNRLSKQCIKLGETNQNSRAQITQTCKLLVIHTVHEVFCSLWWLFSTPFPPISLMSKLLITTRADPDVSQLLWKHHSSHDDWRRFILLLRGLTQMTEGGWGDVLSVFILMAGCFNLHRQVNGAINMCMTREIYEPNTRLITPVITA